MQIIIQTTLLYWGTALDLLLILAILYVKYDKKFHPLIGLGQMVGSLLLIAVSLMLAFIFKFVPDQWILGFLGLIPLAFGLKYLFLGDDDEDEIEEQLEKRKGKNLFFTVIILAFASCGADNIGLFTPYFVSLSTANVLLSVVVFLVNIIILGFLGKFLAQAKKAHEILEHSSRWIMSAIYIGLGILILVESGTVVKVLQLFS
ncbi:cadmium resistance transporter [Lactovum odontotermitis]